MKLKHLLMVSLLALSLFSTSAARACEPQAKGLFSWFHHTDSDNDREKEREREKNSHHDSAHDRDTHHECSGKGQTTTTTTTPTDPVYK